MSLLPDVSSIDNYRMIYRNPEIWIPAMQVLCQRHSLDQSQLKLGPPGTHVVYFAGPKKVIKLFAPLWPDDFPAEYLVLQKISDNLELKAPQLITSGVLEGWPYIIMNKVRGIPAEKAWEFIPSKGKREVISQLGSMMSALHKLPTEGLEALDVDWFAFIRHQRLNCREHHAKAGTAVFWLDEIEEFIGQIPPLFKPGFQKVLIHADITIEHIFVENTNKGWEISGFIDYGDAMLGHPLYDFAAPSFITIGNPELQHRLFLAYGFSLSEINETLSNRLLAYALLHKFGTLHEYLDLFDNPKPANLLSFQKNLWSF